MMQKKIYLLLIFLLPLSLFSQNIHDKGEAFNWLFGSNSWLRFNAGDTPEPLSGSALFTSEGTVSVSDQSGNLLFYSNGVNVYNRNNEIMLNGNDLGGHVSSTQSALAVRKPGSRDIYYLFTVPAVESVDDNLRYSVIDMSGDGGLGKVTEKNISLNKKTAEKIIAVINENRSDVWIVTKGKKDNSDIYYSFLITPVGVRKEAVISNSGSEFTKDANYRGQLKASSDGKILAAAIPGTSENTVQILKFDNRTGNIDPDSVITLPVDYSPYGIAFSPDNSKLYVTTWDIDSSKIYRLLQFDLSSDDQDSISDSKKTIYENDDAAGLRALQQGPDGRIYAAKFNSERIGVVNYPNNPADSVEFRNTGIDLQGEKSTIGLPAFINSDYGVNTFCDEPHFNKEKIRSVDDLILTVDAVQIDRQIRLTDAAESNVGTFWYHEMLPVKYGFRSQFSFSVTDGDNNGPGDGSLPGADGLAFVLKISPPETIGESGFGMGYHHLTNCLAVEIDLYKNDEITGNDMGDPNGNHIAVQSGGIARNTANHKGSESLGLNGDIVEINNDGTIYFCEIYYSALEEKLEIYLDSTNNFLGPVLVVQPIKLDLLLDLKNGELAYAGFTSSTGRGWEKHFIHSWSFCPEHNEVVTAVDEINFPAGTGPGIKMYPNPVRNKLNFVLNSSEQISGIDILDMNGRTIGAYERNSKTLDVSSLAPGLYFLKIRTIDNTYIDKFVKL